MREEDNWFGIIIDSKNKGKRFGTFLLNELKLESSVLNGWVVDHQNDVKQNEEIYLSPLGFYTRNGFIVNENMRMENDKISAVKIRWERR
ncbi:hypothetical protein D3C86_2099260 [compost metagenome]